MQVWEKINELKGANATLKTIKDWSYMNRIPPCELEEGLELDCAYPEQLNEIQKNLCGKISKCYPECLDTFFEQEVEGETGNAN